MDIFTNWIRAFVGLIRNPSSLYVTALIYRINTKWQITLGYTKQVWFSFILHFQLYILPVYFWSTDHYDQW